MLTLNIIVTCPITSGHWIAQIRHTYSKWEALREQITAAIIPTITCTFLFFPSFNNVAFRKYRSRRCRRECARAVGLTAFTIALYRGRAKTFPRILVRRWICIFYYVKMERTCPTSITERRTYIYTYTCDVIKPFHVQARPLRAEIATHILFCFLLPSHERSLISELINDLPRTRWTSTRHLPASVSCRDLELSSKVNVFRCGAPQGLGECGGQVEQPDGEGQGGRGDKSSENSPTDVSTLIDVH